MSELDARYAESFAELVRNSPDGKDLTREAMSLRINMEHEFVSSLPDRLKPEFAARVMQKREAIGLKALAKSICSPRQRIAPRVMPKASIVASSSSASILARSMPPSGSKKTRSPLRHCLRQKRKPRKRLPTRVAGHRRSDRGQECEAGRSLARHGRHELLCKQGPNPAQAAGIVGNLMQESGSLKTTAIGDQGTAFGVSQWRH
jgi:hypothetical protein